MEDASRTLATNARFAGTRAPAPGNTHLAFSYATPDSSHLALIDLETLTVQPIHAHAGEVVYSLAWHPTGNRLAFAYYTPTADGDRGPGDVRVTDLGGSTRRVGCRAAREVLHWLPGGSLATRDDDNLYVVSESDCQTLASADARRMYHITYAPNGRRLAYIHRELNYDRSARDYVPDSTLVLSDARVQNTEELFDSDRRVRHLRWAPEASELAFDMHVDESDRRQIVIYNSDTDRTVYLTPPTSAIDADQVHPRWSPSGRHLAFTVRSPDGTSAAVRVSGQTRRLGASAGPVWGWLGDEAIVVQGADSLRITSLDGDTKYARPAPTALIHAWTRTTS